MKKATVVLGSQWGDEGKGKVTDYLSENVDVVVRFNGGANAGHTIVVDGNEYAFHLVPSGTARKGKRNIMAAGMVIDPILLTKEIEQAEKTTGEVNLLVSDRAHVVFPKHKRLDGKQEANRDSKKKIGTTGRGIGPTYSDKSARKGMRMGDFVRLDTPFPDHIFDSFHTEEETEALWEARDKIRPYVGNTELELHKLYKEDKQILFEGAQGTMLDLDFGTYPYVTSSNCTAGAAASLSGTPPTNIGRVVGVVKAYTTRVGTGPFPSEIIGPEADYIRRIGKEYGVTTGRPRRIGWIDMIQLRHAVRVSGFTEIALTKLDILENIPVKMCIGYLLDGELIDYVPSRWQDYMRCKPILRDVDIMSSIAKNGQLQLEANSYVRVVQYYAECKVKFVGIGPDRKDMIVLE